MTTIQAPTQANRTSIRASIRAKRKALTPNDQQQSSQLLLEHLTALTLLNKARHVAVYLANDGEPNLQPFIHWCWQHNINTYLPVIHPFSKGNLLFLHYHNKSEMVHNQYKILEPKLNVNEVLANRQLDIIFTPLVAFDSQGNRLGMGGGYYDRTLAAWYHHKDKVNKPFPIGIAHDCQQVEKIPQESWDIPIPEIITPSKHFIF